MAFLASAASLATASSAAEAFVASWVASLAIEASSSLAMVTSWVAS
jgi:hypothetical protein